MTEVSNKTIVALLAIALVVTISGTIISISKLSKLSGTVGILTAAATGGSGGNATVTIQSVTRISNSAQNTSIGFGSGYVNGSGSCAVCRLDTNGIVDNSTCCVGFNTHVRGWLLENTGNENISVNWSCAGSCAPALFLGDGTNFEFKVTPNAIAGQDNEQGSLADTSNSCRGVQGTVAEVFANPGWNVTNATTSSTLYPQANYVGITGASPGGWLCGNASHYPFQPNDEQDAAVIDLNITLTPSTQGTGAAKTATFTFNAASTG